MEFIPSPSGTRLAVNSGPTSPGLISNDSFTAVHFKTVQCQQDTVGASYFEVFASLIGSVIVVINLVTIAAIVFRDRRDPNRHKHKVIFQCICNVAVADFLAGLLLLWIFGVQKAVLPLRTALTELVQKSVWTVTLWSSTLSQLVIAVHRHYCVTKKVPDEGGSEWRRFIKIGIALTWLIPIITFVLPVVTIWNCAKDCVCQMPSNSSTGVYYMVCSPVESCSQINPPFTKGSMLFLGLTLILMPSIPCVLYAKIYHFKLTFQTKRLTNPPPNSVQRDDEQDKKLLCTLIIILGVLLVCTVPLGVLFLISFRETDKRYVEATKVLLTISLINSFINPVILFWRFKEMRKSIKKWFTACRRSDGSVNSTTSTARANLNRLVVFRGIRRGESLVENEPAPATAAARDQL